MRRKAVVIVIETFYPGTAYLWSSHLLRQPHRYNEFRLSGLHFKHNLATSYLYFILLEINFSSALFNPTVQV